MAVALNPERQRAPGEAAGQRSVVRVKTLVGAMVLGVGAVIAIVLGVFVAWWAALWGLAVAGGLWFGVVVPRVKTAEDRILGWVPGLRQADPHLDARLLNLVDGLTPSAGLPRPRCFVVDDPARNLLVLGRDPRHGCVVVTRGLLDAASRMEMEAVVAHALVTLRDRLTAGPTLALAVGGERLLSVAGEPPAPAHADFSAVMLTRYPPGLVGALRRVLEGGRPVAAAGTPPALDRLWLARPGDADALTVRVEVLEDL